MLLEGDVIHLKVRVILCAANPSGGENNRGRNEGANNRGPTRVTHDMDGRPHPQGGEGGWTTREEAYGRGGATSGQDVCGVDWR